MKSLTSVIVSSADEAPVEASASGIQWYPGHIAKLERQLAVLLKPVDIVLEIVDARAPVATRHPHLQQRFLSNKPTGLLLNKIDVADSSVTALWLSCFRKNQPSMGFSATQGQNQSVVSFVLKLAEPLRHKQQRMGLKATKPIKLAILGMPNVGKSSLINRLVQKQKAKTGHQAGVTRQPQWVQIHPELILLDTPGMIPPKLDSYTQGLLLSVLHGVGEDAFDNETAAQFLMERLELLYPGCLQTHYHLGQTPPTLPLLAIAQNVLGPGGEPDIARISLRLLTDFRHGRLGRLSLENQLN